MKQIITLILTLLLCVSCVTPSQQFLARKHRTNDSEIKVIWESKPKFSYSPFIDMKNVMDFTELYVDETNYDSLITVYNLLKLDNTKKFNSISYDVVYKHNNDTLKQKIYFIETKNYQIKHDNDIINKMMDIIENNLSRFTGNNDVIIRQNVQDSIFI